MHKVDSKVSSLERRYKLKWTSFFLFFLMLSGTALSIPHKLDQEWESISTPEIMSRYLTRDFSELPLSGSVISTSKYWSGDYWALKKGSINYRWYAKKKIGFNLNSPDYERARNMRILELAELSPAEKYDLYTGRYDYPLKKEVDRIADPKAEFWEGMCHGWSPATMNHNEPTSKLLRNPDGIAIPFGSTDIKALLSYYYAYQFNAPDTHQMGRRCFKGQYFNKDKDCHDDLNAGAFHLVLANRLGLDGKGFIADLQRYKEVWNHPITSYNSEILKETGPGPKSAPGTIKQIYLKTKIDYLDENGHDWHPVKGTRKQFYKTVWYSYSVELDSHGKIIGGEWHSEQRPDFLWLMYRPRAFEGLLFKLGELLNDD